MHLFREKYLKVQNLQYKISIYTLYIITNEINFYFENIRVGSTK